MEIPHEIGDRYPAILLRDGTTLRNAEIIGVELVIKHDGGIIRVEPNGFRPGTLPPVEEFFKGPSTPESAPQLPASQPEDPAQPTRGSGEGVWEDLSWGQAAFETYQSLRQNPNVTRLQGGALQLRAELRYEGLSFFLYPDMEGGNLDRIRIRGNYHDVFAGDTLLRREWEILYGRLLQRFGSPKYHRSFEETYAELAEGINESSFWDLSGEQIRLCLNKVDDRVYAIVYLQPGSF